MIDLRPQIEATVRFWTTHLYQGNANAASYGHKPLTEAQLAIFAYALKERLESLVTVRTRPSTMHLAWDENTTEALWRLEYDRGADPILSGPLKKAGIDFQRSLIGNRTRLIAWVDRVHVFEGLNTPVRRIWPVE